MRILIFNWRDTKNPSGGGAEVFTHEIAKRWVIRGHKVTLFTAAFPNGECEEMVDGVKIIRNGGKYSVYQMARNYYKKHAKGNYDIIIDEINTRPFLTPKFANNSEKIFAFIPQLAREFWFYEMPFPVNWVGHYWLEPRWLKNYINIPTITISESTKQDLLKIGFKHVEIVPVGLNTKPLSCVPEKEDLPTLIFVGRMGHAKCPDHILEAFTYIKREIPSVRLWMVGDGAMKKKLEALKMVDVTFFGYVENTKKHNLMSRAHAILVPGLREGWGLVATEANAKGTPAVGYNIHGLRDSIRNNDTGLLCEPTPKAMSEKAIKLLRDATLRKRLSENALSWSGKFDWNKSADEFLKVLDAGIC